MKRPRSASIHRVTDETDIYVEILIDGVGKGDINTSLKFLDHMLETFAKYSKFDIKIKAEGDLKHHIVEDVGITLGLALKTALEDRDGIRRFGSAIVPMDDALVVVAVDLKERIYFSSNLRLEGYIEDVYYQDIIHFLRSFTYNMVATVHINQLAGYNFHHIVEASFKGLGMAFREGVRLR